MAFASTSHTKVDANSVQRALSECHPEGARELGELLAMARQAEEATVRRIAVLEEALAPTWDPRKDFDMTADRPKQDPGVCRLRVFIYNSATNQPRDPDGGLASFTHEDWSRKDPPSWTLRIQGTVDDTQRALGAKLTSFVSKIVIITKDETIIWDRRSYEGPDVDGIELKRTGNQEMAVRVLLFLDYKTPQYTLSQELTQLTGGTQQASLAGVIKKICEYARTRGGFLPGPHFAIKADAAIKKLFPSVGDSVSLSSLPDLCRPHLRPPKPIEVTHQLKLHCDWIDTETSYEICIETPHLLHTDLSKALHGQPSIAEARRQIEVADEQVSKILERIQHHIRRRNHMLAFANSPVEVGTDVIPLKSKPMCSHQCRQLQ